MDNDPRPIDQLLAACQNFGGYAKTLMVDSHVTKEYLEGYRELFREFETAYGRAKQAGHAARTLAMRIATARPDELPPLLEQLPGGADNPDTTGLELTRPTIRVASISRLVFNTRARRPADGASLAIVVECRATLAGPQITASAYGVRGLPVPAIAQIVAAYKAALEGHR